MMLTPRQVLDIAQKEHLNNQTDYRRDQQEWLYHYYMGSQPELKSYLNEVLQKTYASDDLESMQLQYVNITRKIISQLAVVYDKPAKRKIVDSKGDEVEEWTEYYESILPDNINTIDKKALDFAKLFSSSLTQVIARKDKMKMRYRIDPNYLYAAHLDEDDPYVIDALFYTNYYKDVEGQEQYYVVVWTKDEHFKVDALTNVTPIGNNQTTDNPLKDIPVARLISDMGVDLWGQGQVDIVNTNEQINFLLTKLVSRDILYGSEGTTLAINCNLIKKGEEEDGIRRIRTGIKTPIAVEGANSNTGLVPPDIRHITTTPLVTEIMEFVDNYLKTIALTKGLDSNSFMQEVKATSGFSKMIDSIEQMEIRNKDVEPCRIYEKERFDKTRTVNNFMASTAEGRALGYKKIPDDVKLYVDFAEIELFRTPEEDQADKEFELNHGLSTEADWLMERNPDIKTKEEAEEIIKENKSKNQTQKGSKLFNLPTRSDDRTNDKDLSDEENI